VKSILPILLDRLCFQKGISAIVPFFVFYLTTQVMIKRPGGYGDISLLEKNPCYNQYISKKPYYIAALICLPFLLIGLFPLIAGYTPILQWFGFVSPGEVFDFP
jgi:hypothetical protein